MGDGNPLCRPIEAGCELTHVLDSLVDFVTSKTGIFAALVGLVGLAVAFQTLIRPWLVDRRDERAKRPRLLISPVQLSDLKSYASSRELRFTLGNGGGGVALMTSLRLRVLEHGDSVTPRQTRTAAPLDVYQHRVEFQKDKDEYDVRARAFGPAVAPLKYESGHVDAFVVTLVAKDPQWYRFVVQADWQDIRNPSEVHTCQSDECLADFPPTIAARLPPME